LEENVEEEPDGSIGFRASIIMVLVVAIAVSICSDNLVGSIDAVVKSSGVSTTFYALILIPIIGNAGISS
jgi:Ca2+:H+ antiporter